MRGRWLTNLFLFSLFAGSYMCLGVSRPLFTLRRCPSQLQDGSVALLTLKGVPIPPISSLRTDIVYIPQEKISEARINQSSSQMPVRLENRRKKRTPTTAVTNMATGVRTWISHGSPRTRGPDDILWSVPTLVAGRQSEELISSKNNCRWSLEG